MSVDRGGGNVGGEVRMLMLDVRMWSREVGMWNREVRMLMGWWECGMGR